MSKAKVIIEGFEFLAERVEASKSSKVEPEVEVEDFEDPESGDEEDLEEEDEVDELESGDEEEEEDDSEEEEDDLESEDGEEVGSPVVLAELPLPPIVPLSAQGELPPLPSLIPLPVAAATVHSEPSKRVTVSVVKRPANPRDLLRRDPGESDNEFGLRTRFVDIASNQQVTLPHGKVGLIPNEELDRYSRMFANYVIYGQSYETDVMNVLKTIRERAST